MRGICTSFAIVGICLSLASVLHAEEPPPRYALLPPKVLPYDDEKPIPLGYHVESHPRQGMIIGGFITFTIAYGFFAVPAISSGGDPVLAIPFVGPFLFIRHERDRCGSNPPCDMQGALDLFFYASGIGQIVGASLVFIGYGSPRHTLVSGVREPASEPGASMFTVKLVPVFAGRQGVGLGAVGAF